MSDVPEPFEVFVTKRWDTRGILRAQAIRPDWYAYDWVRLYPDGQTFLGEALAPGEWHRTEQEARAKVAELRLQMVAFHEGEAARFAAVDPAAPPTDLNANHTYS